jgi:dissimilatory sulfite reductase (desulfoviridin) alpha/beta subunit
MTPEVWRYAEGRISRKESTVGEHFALKNNQIFVLAEAAGGVYNSDQLRTLCEVADNESAFLKITEDQRIGFMIDPAKLPDIQAQVRKIGLLLRSYKAPGVPSPRACLGELCTYSHQPSLGDALELTTHLLKSFPAPKRYSSIGVNGCGRACLGSSTEDVHIVAEETGYKISIGGKISDLPQQAHLLVENVSRTDLPIVVEKILAVFYQESVEGERIHDVVERIGLSPFINALPEHLNIAAADPIVETTELPEPLAEIDSAEPGLMQDLSTQEQVDAANGSLNDSISASSDALIDDLLDSSSEEFAGIDGENGLVSSDTQLDPAIFDDSEPSVDISGGLATIDAPLMAEVVEDESVQIEQGLLEEAEFEDGTLEDVERVRDAIRTELSMSPGEDIKETHAQRDLLDEIEQEGEKSEFSQDNAFADQSLESSSLDEHLDAVDEDDTAFANGESSWSESGDSSHSETDESFDSHSAATFEHQPPAKHKRINSKVSSSAEFRQEKEAAVRRPAEHQPPVSGRLAIKFEGDQLAIELPSGMCFDLPFDAVPEGAEFSMVLPDGELRMERDGAALAVRLGALNMRFPIPKMSTRRVA